MRLIREMRAFPAMIQEKTILSFIGTPADLALSKALRLLYPCIHQAAPFVGPFLRSDKDRVRGRVFPEHAM
jgi:hypothetical protein